MRRRLAITVFMLLICLTGICGTIPLLPRDPSVVCGSLRGGLTYYILRSENTETGIEIACITRSGRETFRRSGIDASRADALRRSLSDARNSLEPVSQALIIVGDVIPADVEKMLVSRFSDLPDIPQEPRTVRSTASNRSSGPRIDVVTSGSRSNCRIELCWQDSPMPQELNSTEVRFNNDLIQRIIAIVMDERLAAASSPADAPISDAQFRFERRLTGSGADITDNTVVTADIIGEYIREAIASLLNEISKMSGKGFSDDEVERAKSLLLLQMQMDADNAGALTDSQLISLLADDYIYGLTFTGADAACRLARTAMKWLNAGLISETASQLIPDDSDEDLFVTIFCPEDCSVPSPKELTALIAEARQSGASGTVTVRQKKDDDAIGQTDARKSGRQERQARKQERKAAKSAAKAGKADRKKRK